MHFVLFHTRILYISTVSAFQIVDEISLQVSWFNQNNPLKFHSKLMVSYFCHHLQDNYFDLSDLYVDLSDLYVDLSDLYVDLSDLYVDLSLIHLLENES